MSYINCHRLMSFKGKVKGCDKNLTSAEFIDLSIYIIYILYYDSIYYISIYICIF